MGTLMGAQTRTRHADLRKAALIYDSNQYSGLHYFMFSAFHACGFTYWVASQTTAMPRKKFWAQKLKFNAAWVELPWGEIIKESRRDRKRKEYIQEKSEESKQATDSDAMQDVKDTSAGCPVKKCRN